MAVALAGNFAGIDVPPTPKVVLVVLVTVLTVTALAITVLAARNGLVVVDEQPAQDPTMHPGQR